MTTQTKKQIVNKEIRKKLYFHILSAHILKRVKYLLLLKNKQRKSLVFRDIAPCSHVEVVRRFRGVYCLHDQGDDEGSTQCLDTFVNECDPVDFVICFQNQSVYILSNKNMKIRYTEALVNK
jgi:hypothetical protein